MSTLKNIAWIAGVLLAGYLAILFLVYRFQHHLIYFPEERLIGTPEDIGLPFQKVDLQTDDQIRLHGWFIPRDDARGTVLYCHGNAGNISGRLETARVLHDLGLQVLLFDYRGYGQSEGKPSERGTYRDAEAAWRYLTEERGIPGDRILVMGRSLGGSIAAYLAKEKKPGALIVESTFTSGADLAADTYPWLPARWMIKVNYPTLEYIRGIEVPVLVGHSRQDQLVAWHHGRELYEAAPDPKVFLEMEGSHGDAFLVTGDRYFQELDRFISKYLVNQSKSEDQ